MQDSRGTDDLKIRYRNSKIDPLSAVHGGSGLFRSSACTVADRYFDLAIGQAGAFASGADFDAFFEYSSRRPA